MQEKQMTVEIEAKRGQGETQKRQSAYLQKLQRKIRRRGDRKWNN